MELSEESSDIPDMDLLLDKSSSDQEPAGIKLERVQAKYSWLKKAACGSLATFITLGILMLVFTYLLYVSVLPSGDANGETAINPYLADAAQTLSMMNSNVDECNDFYAFATQAWQNANSNTNLSRVSYSFGSAEAAVRAEVVNILQQDWPYLGPFYRSCEDLPRSAGSNQARFQKISTWAIRLSGLNNATEIFRYAAKLRLQNGIDLGLLFELSVMSDPDTAETYVYSVNGRGFSLPAKSYYSEVSTLQWYSGWISSMFQIAGMSITSARISNLIALEKTLGDYSLSVEQLYDPLVTTNYYNTTTLVALVGPIAYAYFQELNLTSGVAFVVDDVQYFQVLRYIGTVAGPNVEILRDLALLRLLRETLPYIDLEGREVSSGFKSYFGTRHPENSDYCIDLTNNYLGWLVSKYYVNTYRAQDTTSQILETAESLRSKLKTMVSSWSWLDVVSKLQALEKYDRLKITIGYPTSWLDYDALFLSNGAPPLSSFDLFGNVHQLDLAYDRAVLAKAGRPVDRYEWYMTPTTVNAYYDPPTNSIVIPLAIELAPFFSVAQPYAANLAMFWAVFAHEAFHVVDSMGALYDSEGRLREWMTPASRAAFDERVACFEEQFSAYTVLSSHNHLNGKLTSGEVLADLNGLLLCQSLLEEYISSGNASWDFEDRWIEDAYDGLTMKQLFFVKYAQLWASVLQPNYALELSRSDPHPLPEYRVLGTFSNMPAFATAFNCKSGAEYNPDTRCSMQ